MSEFYFTIVLIQMNDYCLEFQNVVLMVKGAEEHLRVSAVLFGLEP